MQAAVAGSLWSDATEGHAYAALRSTLIRMNRACRDTLLVTPSSLELAPGVSVDLHEAQALAHRLLETGPHAAVDLSVAAVATLSSELLPLWYDDWVAFEAEDWRQLHLHALEAVVDRAVAAGAEVLPVATAFRQATGRLPVPAGAGPEARTVSPA